MVDQPTNYCAFRRGVAISEIGSSLATLSVGTTAVEGPISAVIRCILSGGGGGGGDRWFGAQPLKHTRPS